MKTRNGVINNAIVAEEQQKGDSSWTLASGCFSGK
jgi:hypothetical protein